jgi:hypothetical protein
MRAGQCGRSHTVSTGIGRRTHGYQATRARGRDAAEIVGGRSALLYTLGGLASSDMRLIVAASSMKRLFSMMTHGWFGALMIVLMQSMRIG